MKTEAKRKSMSGSKLTGQEISAYFRKNPKAKKDKNVKKAVEIALDHGGAMNYAVDKIEKLKKGLSGHPEVEKALTYANFGESIARDKFKAIIRENYTKNFELLCQSLKFNKIQQKILDDFIHKGRIRDQYVGRVAGTKKEKRIFAGKKKFTGSIENRNQALMQALKVNAKQKSILDSYLKTGRVIGKYTGSIAGSTKTTKSYTGFRGFKEHFELTEGFSNWSVEVKPGLIAGKNIKRQTVKVKAQSVSHAIKLVAKKLGVDFKQLSLGKTKKESVTEDKDKDAMDWWDAGQGFKKEIKDYRKKLAKYRMTDNDAKPDAKKEMDKKMYAWIVGWLKKKGSYDKHKTLSLNGQINNLVKIYW